MKIIAFFQIYHPSKMEGGPIKSWFLPAFTEKKAKSSSLKKSDFFTVIWKARNIFSHHIKKKLWAAKNSLRPFTITAMNHTRWYRPITIDHMGCVYTKSNKNSIFSKTKTRDHIECWVQFHAFNERHGLDKALCLTIKTCNLTRRFPFKFTILSL